METKKIKKSNKMTDVYSMV